MKKARTVDQILKDNFDDFGPAGNNMHWVQKKGLFGFYSDKTKKLVLPTICSCIIRITECANGNLYVVQRGKHWGIFSTKTQGLLVHIGYTSIQVMSEEFILTKTTTKSIPIPR